MEGYLDDQSLWGILNALVKLKPLEIGILPIELLEDRKGSTWSIGRVKAGVK